MKSIDAKIEQLTLQEYVWSEDREPMELDRWMVEDFVDLFAEYDLDQSHLNEQFLH